MQTYLKNPNCRTIETKKLDFIKNLPIFVSISPLPMMTAAYRHIMTITLIALASIIIVISVCDIMVICNAEGRTYSSTDEIPAYGTALLLGTSPTSSRHTRNNSFYNRIHAAADLFHAGKVSRIIASGGDYSLNGGRDEPLCMKQCLVNAGVPADSITLDYDGRRTILSIINARDKYGLDSIIIVSQHYHNQRALMQADHFRLNAIGFDAAPTPAFIDKARNWARERLARVKLMYELLTDAR